MGIFRGIAYIVTDGMPIMIKMMPFWRWGMENFSIYLFLYDINHLIADKPLHSY